MNATRPRPAVTDLNRAFFDGLARGQLQLQRCASCKHLRHPISAVCPRCLNREFRWEVLSGQGRVFSSVVFHQVYAAAFADDVPYNVSIVELEEGPRLMTNVVGIAPAEVRVGDAVAVDFRDLGDGLFIHQFRWRAPAASVR